MLPITNAAPKNTTLMSHWIIITATTGDIAPAMPSMPSGTGSVAMRNVATSSHRAITTMIAMRTRVARCRLSTHAPTVYIARNSATWPT